MPDSPCRQSRLWGRICQLIQQRAAVGALRPLAHSLRAAQPLGRAGRAGVGLGAADAQAGAGQTAGRGLVGQHDHQAAPGRGGSAENREPQAIGRSCDGWTTNPHLLVRDDRGVLTLRLSPGQAHDAPAGRDLLEHFGLHGGPPPC